jgi:hypothetical protein
MTSIGILPTIESGKSVFMPKRNLRIVTQDVPIVGFCEACDTQFKSFDVNEAERVVKAQFDAHECKPLDATQPAVRIVREVSSLTLKWKRWLWIAFWTALAGVTALMWPWDWAGW